MLYNDESSKKRTISSLAEQRQQITSLSPHQNQPQPSKRIKLDTQDEQFKYEEQVDNAGQHGQFPASAEAYQYASTSSDPGYVISSSLNYVYDNSQVYATNGEPEEEEAAPAVHTFESGFQPPRNFVSCARNSNEPWLVQLYLEEPYDPNQRSFYPKHLVYPGDGQEYSLEELKSQKLLAKIEERKQEELRAQQEELRTQQEAESLRHRQEQERLRQEQEAKRLIEEQERIRKEQEAQRIRLDQEKLQREEVAQRDAYQTQLAYQQQQQQPVPAWNCHNQSPASYGNYYPHSSYDNSPQYSYSHDHRYQSHGMYQTHMYQQSPQHYQNSPNYQNSPSYIQPHQPQSVIVNRNQYESQHVQHQQPVGDPYYSSPHQQQHQYVGDESYHTYHPQPQMPQVVPPHPIASPVVAPARQPYEEPDYQDVEYLIDHQGEIDPNMLQQPIVESLENTGDENCDDDDEPDASSSDYSEEEPYSGPKPVVNSYSMLDDLEEQIEASTISFSSNGKSRDKKLTIKFRKEKTSTIIHSESNSESSIPPARSYTAPSSKNSLEPSSTSSSSSGKKKSRKQKFQNEILNTFEGDNTQFMPSATNNSCSSTANGDLNQSFGSVSFNGCVTPVRKGVSKSSTPVSTYKFLRKPESIVSNQNDDSICSFTGDQNSFFQAENDEDLKGRRMERALETIEEHKAKRDIDPFNSELCKAFLIKLNFPNRENTADYKITNTNLSKLWKNQHASLGGATYQIEKEVGRGSYGAVFRWVRQIFFGFVSQLLFCFSGVNTNDGSAVALKYQKPPNPWELYICCEVKKRLKNANIVSAGNYRLISPKLIS